MSRPDSGKRRHRAKPLRGLLDTCPASGGKVRYPSRKKALTALNALRALKTLQTYPTQVYKCRACHAWHLTSRPLPAADVSSNPPKGDPTMPTQPVQRDGGTP